MNRTMGEEARSQAWEGRWGEYLSVNELALIQFRFLTVGIPPRVRADFLNRALDRIVCESAVVAMDRISDALLEPSGLLRS
jgi:hypothetical protein